jgi:hypothetical protein
MKWTTTVIDYADSNTAEWSAFTSSTAMACKREKIIYFFLNFVFFILFSSSFSSRAAIRAIHYMTARSKTHRSA